MSFDCATISNILILGKTSHNDPKMFKLLCPPNSKQSDDCHLSWTSKGVLLTSNTKGQIRINEIVNTLKTMDNHFGKQKFRSGNIPFTLFGPFDQKSNVLFMDSTDGLKTKFEFNKIKVFGRNLEDHLDSVQQSHQICSLSNRIQSLKLSSLVFTAISLIVVQIYLR